MNRHSANLEYASFPLADRPTKVPLLGIEPSARPCDRLDRFQRQGYELVSLAAVLTTTAREIIAFPLCQTIVQAA